MFTVIFSTSKAFGVEGLRGSLGFYFRVPEVACGVRECFFLEWGFGGLFAQTLPSLGCDLGFRVLCCGMFFTGSVEVSKGASVGCFSVASGEFVWHLVTQKAHEHEHFMGISLP